MSIYLCIPLPGLDLAHVRWYSRQMEISRPASGVDLLDDLVQRSQELADLYVRCVDENPGARVDKPHDAGQVEGLFQALARFYLVERLAVDAVAAYVSGALEPLGLTGDF